MDFEFVGVAAVVLAALAGFLLSGEVLSFIRRKSVSNALRGGTGFFAQGGEGLLHADAADLILRCALRASSRARSGGLGLLAVAFRGRGSADELRAKVLASGLGEHLSVEGVLWAQAELAVVCSAVGFACGLFLSGAMALLLAAAGLLFGWRAPLWALDARVRRRAEQVERHLPEMLDVISLGLRSGLSFEGALDAYCRHFDTLLARELAAAKDRWSGGLLSRDEALRAVADSFSSPVLKRVLGDVARSLRYGSALSESLASVAVEVRKEYRARKQEEVAKAPVKMMIPTGVLILPAMLILVLGPVMLELAAGF